MPIPGGIRIVTATVDPASLATDAIANTSVTVVGVQTDHEIIPIPPSDLEAGLVAQGATVSAQDTISLRISNTSAGTVDGASKTWTFIIVTGETIALGSG